METFIPRKKLIRFRIFFMVAVGSFYIGRAFYQRVILDADSSPLIVAILGTLCLFSLIYTIHSFLAAINNKPAIILSSKGMTDNISYAKAGFIDWEKIDYIDIQKLGGKQNLIVHLHDKQVVLKRVGGWKNFILEDVIKKTGSPLAFSPVYADFELEELKERMSKLKNASLN